MRFDDTETADKLLATSDARKQKTLGRQVWHLDRAVWDDLKFDIMKRSNYENFIKNKSLFRKLFQNDEKIIVVANPLDTICGIGLDEAAAQATDPKR